MSESAAKNVEYESDLTLITRADTAAKTAGDHAVVRQAKDDLAKFGRLYPMRREQLEAVCEEAPYIPPAPDQRPMHIVSSETRVHTLDTFVGLKKGTLTVLSERCGRWSGSYSLTVRCDCGTEVRMDRSRFTAGSSTMTCSVSCPLSSRRADHPYGYWTPSRVLSEIRRNGATNRSQVFRSDKKLYLAQYRHGKEDPKVKARIERQFARNALARPPVKPTSDPILRAKVTVEAAKQEALFVNTDSITFMSKAVLASGVTACVLILLDIVVTVWR